MKGLDKTVPEEPSEKDKEKEKDKLKELKPGKESKNEKEVKVKLTFEEYQLKKMEKLLHDIGKMEKEDV